MSENSMRMGAALTLLVLGIAGCAIQRPVLSSNEQLMRVGPEIAQQDIDNCMERAKATSTESGTDSSQNAAAGAATSSVVGAAAGGAGGAVFGQAGQGAAAGAVGESSVASRRRLSRDCFGLNRLRHPLGSSWIVAFVKRATSLPDGNSLSTGDCLARCNCRERAYRARGFDTQQNRIVSGNHRGIGKAGRAAGNADRS
jgi:hypothetical protein